MEGPSLSAINMPNTDGDVLALLKEHAPLDHEEPATAYLENLVKFAKRNMPSSSMSTYASNWGVLKGVLMALDYRLILVTPQKWQKALGLGTSNGRSKTEWKSHLRGEAQRLFPRLKITNSTADAALIGEAARRGLLG